MLTIVMYHYVRDPARTRYPDIKALRTDEFELQLDHVARTFEVVSLRDVLSAVTADSSLPENACLLTFDDGLADHHETVFPRLRERGMTGTFFPAGLPLTERVVLDVHKIHYILAATDEASIVATLFEQLERMRASRRLPSAEELRSAYERGDRFDTPEVTLIKASLQFGLAADVRAELVDSLFDTYVEDAEEDLARDLYLGIPELREMIRGGMEVGGHGWTHRWLGKLSCDEQAEEIRRTVGLLEHIQGSPLSDWTMCYPYGSYNAHTLNLVRECGARLGLTTNPGAVLRLDRPLELARLDTIDLPPRGCADGRA